MSVIISEFTVWRKMLKMSGQILLLIISTVLVLTVIHTYMYTQTPLIRTPEIQSRL